MEKKIKIYTKTGDQGKTSLVGGTRLLKSDPQIDLYGEVDHLNSLVGLAIIHVSDQEVIKVLKIIQNTLFDLGSLLATESDKREEFKLPKLTELCITVLEGEIDRMDEELPVLKNFILPGGSRASAYLHQCRTHSRKVERRLVEFFQTKPELTPQYSLEYLNRLSDYFFV